MKKVTYTFSILATKWKDSSSFEDLYLPPVVAFLSAMQNYKPYTQTCGQFISSNQTEQSHHYHQPATNAIIMTVIETHREADRGAAYRNTL